jgi:hypothetical protein
MLLKNFTLLKNKFKGIQPGHEVLSYAVKDAKIMYNVTATQGLASGLPCSFIDEMPEEVHRTSRGYLLYDLDTELFAGGDEKWRERARNLLIEGDDIYIPTILRPRLREEWKKLNTVEEVLAVPCVSYESPWIGDDLFIYQVFDWKWAFGIKSRSGKLPGM